MNGNNLLCLCRVLLLYRPQDFRVVANNFRNSPSRSTALEAPLEEELLAGIFQQALNRTASAKSSDGKVEFPIDHAPVNERSIRRDSFLIGL
jgi:hypothetical protein